MGLILDSSILIAAERKKFDLVAFIEAEAPGDDIYISAVTASELLHGVHRSKPKYRTGRESFVEAVIRDTPTLPFDLLSARNHAKLWATLESGGERIGAHDMQIAATCLRFDHRLATLNEKEFIRVEGLQLANARPYIIDP